MAGTVAAADSNTIATIGVSDHLDIPKHLYLFSPVRDADLDVVA